MTKPPRITETQEHRAIAAYFRRVGLGGCALALHLRNERAGDWQRIEAHRMGVTAGCPDWCILDGGRALFFELKPRGWKARKAKTGNYTAHELRQLDMHKKLAHAGCVVEIVETLDEMLALLTHYCVPLRTESRVTEGIRRGLLAALAEEPEPLPAAIAPRDDCQAERPPARVLP